MYSHGTNGPSLVTSARAPSPTSLLQKSVRHCTRLKCRVARRLISAVAGAPGAARSKKVLAKSTPTVLKAVESLEKRQPSVGAAKHLGC